MLLSLSMAALAFPAAQAPAILPAEPRPLARVSQGVCATDAATLGGPSGGDGGRSTERSLWNAAPTDGAGPPLIVKVDPLASRRLSRTNVVNRLEIRP